MWVLLCMYKWTSKPEFANQISINNYEEKADLIWHIWQKSCSSFYCFCACSFWDYIVEQSRWVVSHPIRRQMSNEQCSLLIEHMTHIYDKSNEGLSLKISWWKSGWRSIKVGGDFNSWEVPSSTSNAGWPWCQCDRQLSCKLKQYEGDGLVRNFRFDVNAMDHRGQTVLSLLGWSTTNW